MKKENRIALIAGTTGLVGSYCLNLVLNSNEYQKVYSITRREIKSDNPKLEQVITDFSQLENINLADNPDVVFCCLGTTIKKAGSRENFRKVDFEYVLNLAKFAEKMKIPQFFLVSSVGTDKNSLFFYSRVKGEIEDALKALSFENLNIIRPSLILGKREESRPIEEISTPIAKGLNNLLFGPLKKYRAIEAEDIAKAMLEISAKNLKGNHTFESDQLEELVVH